MTEDRTVQHGMDNDLLKHRQKHDGGLVQDFVRSGSRLVSMRLRAKKNAALDEILIAHGLKDVAERLEAAQIAMDAGLGMTVMDVNRIRGSSSAASDFIDNIVNAYIRWPAECKRLHHSPMMCREVVIEGATLEQTDAKHKFRKGTAKKNLIACLEIFAKMT